VINRSRAYERSAGFGDGDCDGQSWLSAIVCPIPAKAGTPKQFCGIPETLGLDPSLRWGDSIMTVRSASIPCLDVAQWPPWSKGVNFVDSAGCRCSGRAGAGFMMPPAPTELCFSTLRQPMKIANTNHRCRPAHRRSLFPMPVTVAAACAPPMMRGRCFDGGRQSCGEQRPGGDAARSDQR